MKGNPLYWQFDDQNPAFMYGPGWSNLTDVNAHDSTLSYTSEKTNVTIQFYGKSIWLFGVIGKTEDWEQPVSRYTLDNRYVSTVVADVKNETSYNELFAHFHDLDSSYHTLVVENIDEYATLFLDYYLVEPIPPNELTESTGNLHTGGEPLRTSISEHPMMTGAVSASSANAPSGGVIGAVVGSILAAILIAIAAFIFWKKRKSSKPYYYKSATVYEVLSDEFESDKYDPERNSATSTVTSNPSYPSSVYSFTSDRSPSSLFPRQTYFPMPSEYQSQKLLAKSDPSLSKSSSHLSLSSGSSTSSSGDHSPNEERPLL